jgi:hypothetical protein
MAGGNWIVVIDLKLPYDVEIRRSEDHRQLRVPFDDKDSAVRALTAMHIEIEQENPVIAGAVVKEDDDDADAKPAV